jgi:hypothetical protein
MLDKLANPRQSVRFRDLGLDGCRCGRDDGNWHSFPVRIAQRPASGYSVTFALPNALQRRSKLIPDRASSLPGHRHATARQDGVVDGGGAGR